MTTLNPATGLSSPELAVTRAGPPLRVRPGARRTAARPEAVDGLWVTVDGLWVAAAGGRYTAVRCAAGPVTLTRRLRPVTARLAPW